MMADINLRWSTDQFWESTLYKIPFSMNNLVIYRLYDLDEDNETAKLARKAIDPTGKVTDLALAKRVVITSQKIYKAYDTKEDIYATEDTRRRLQEKIDVRTTDTRPYYDPTPTYWTILKHVNRRPLQTKTRSQARRKNPLVARIPRRHASSNLIASNTDGIVRLVTR